MKSKILLAVLAAHLLGCVFLSFDWAFLAGEYLGFGMTFLLVYIVSVPLLVGGVALVRGVYGALKKNGTVSDFICGGIGIAILLLYVLSACGVLSGSPLLSAAYLMLVLGTLSILAIWVGCAIYKRKKQKSTE